MPPKRDVKPAKWECAWDSKSGRWYYQDRVNGTACWDKPKGCTLELPTEEPKAPEPPADLPPGWEAAWDPTHGRFYFYNRVTSERQWKKPGSSTTTTPTGAAGRGPTSPATAAAGARGKASAAAEENLTMIDTGPQRAQNAANTSASSTAARDRSAGRGRSAPGAAEWDAEDFLLRLRQAKSSGDRHSIKRVMKEVSESNYTLRGNFMPVPRTVAIPPSATERARVSGAGRDPQISFSRMTTADAAFHFAVMSPKAVICALNFANGSQIGGGYKNGAIAQEEDLCRRFPQLYTSLYNASREGLYPFGPATCFNVQSPGKYSDVLFTKDVILARANEEDGFAIMEPAMQKKISLVTAAAPNMSEKGKPGLAKDLYDRALLYKTVKSIFIAPKMQNEQINTLILGAWGCGVFGGDPRDISELFVQAIQADRLGRLYSEIHFAIPSFNPEDLNSKTFLETLTRHRIPYTEIDPASR
mmetsp:Transcript_131684/g.228160  ORF Transcript_131684/g.228160 Transcript_131684/m.228160 type:complete len:473 (+) Transcript_131684:71-1489(+)